MHTGQNEKWTDCVETNDGKQIEKETFLEKLWL